MYLERELVEKSDKKSIFKAYQENRLTIVKRGDVYYFECIPYNLRKLVVAEMRKYFPELSYLYDEF